MVLNRTQAFAFPLYGGLPMKNIFVLVLFAISLASGCRATGRLYPVQGPLSAQTPTPVLLAKLTGAFNSGNISVVLADGEVCKGHWATVPRPGASKGAAASTAPPSEMSSVWDTVYGPGFFVAHVLGKRLYVQTALTGDRGTNLNLEMYKPDGNTQNTVSSIQGVAKDSKDNIYKLAF
jgi:hypothetical protein